MSSSISALETTSKKWLDGGKYQDNLQIGAVGSHCDAARRLLETFFVYIGGTSTEGLPIVILSPGMLQAAESPSSSSSLDIAALAMVQAMDAVTRGPFAMLICHNGSDFLGTGNYSWLQSAYGWLPRRYKKNMKRLWILHPTFTLRAIFAVVSPFISSKFWKKLQYLHTCDEAAAVATPEGLVLPRDVLALAGERSDAAAASLEAALIAESSPSMPIRSGDGSDDALTGSSAQNAHAAGGGPASAPLGVFAGPLLAPAPSWSQHQKHGTEAYAGGEVRAPRESSGSSMLSASSNGSVPQGASGRAAAGAAATHTLEPALPLAVLSCSPPLLHARPAERGPSSAAPESSRFQALLYSPALAREGDPVLSLRPALPRVGRLIERGKGTLVLLRSQSAWAATAGRHARVIELLGRYGEGGGGRAGGSLEDTATADDTKQAGEGEAKEAGGSGPDGRGGPGKEDGPSPATASLASAGVRREGSWRRLAMGSKRAAAPSLLGLDLEEAGRIQGPGTGVVARIGVVEVSPPAIIAACVGALLLPMRRAGAGSGGDGPSGAGGQARAGDEVSCQWLGLDAEGLMRVPPRKEAVMQVLCRACARGGEELAGGTRLGEREGASGGKSSGCDRYMNLLRAGLQAWARQSEGRDILSPEADILPVEAHVVAGVLAEYMRLLPEPIVSGALSAQLSQALACCQGVADVGASIERRVGAPTDSSPARTSTEPVERSGAGGMPQEASGGGEGERDSGEVWASAGVVHAAAEAASIAPSRAPIRALVPQQDDRSSAGAGAGEGPGSAVLDGSPGASKRRRPPRLGTEEASGGSSPGSGSGSASKSGPWSRSARSIGSGAGGAGGSPRGGGVGFLAREASSRSIGKDTGGPYRRGRSSGGGSGSGGGAGPRRQERRPGAGDADKSAEAHAQAASGPGTRSRAGPRARRAAAGGAPGSEEDSPSGAVDYAGGYREEGPALALPPSGREGQPDTAGVHVLLAAVRRKPVVQRRAAEMRVLAALAALDDLRESRPFTHAALQVVLRLVASIEARKARNRMGRAALVVCLAPLLVGSSSAADEADPAAAGASKTVEEAAASATRSIGQKMQVAGALMDAGGVDGRKLQASIMTPLQPGDRSERADPLASLRGAAALLAPAVRE